MTGQELIVAERERQVSELGYDTRHDDAHRQDEIAKAAHCYARAANVEMHTGRMQARLPATWPWAPTFWKPTGGPVRLLVKAGALYQANAERLRRVDTRSTRVQAMRCAELASDCARLIDALESGEWKRPEPQCRRVIVTMDVYGSPEAADALMKNIGDGIGLDWLNHMSNTCEGAVEIGYVEFAVKGERWVEKSAGPEAPALPPQEDQED